MSGEHRDPVEEWKVQEIRIASEHVCALILYGDMPLIDIRIAAAEVRRLCLRHFPERAWLFDLVYAARFRRLWAQWRADEPWR
jgi:hypothetical protein